MPYLIILFFIIILVKTIQFSKLILKIIHYTNDKLDRGVSGKDWILFRLRFTLILLSAITYVVTGHRRHLFHFRKKHNFYKDGYLIISARIMFLPK